MPRVFQPITRKHLLIECGRTLDSDAHFYYIMLGKSVADGRRAQRIAERCSQRGFFFHLLDNDTDQFLQRVRHSLAGNVRIDAMSAREYLSMVCSGGGVMLADAPVHSRHMQRKALSIDYRISCNLSAAGRKRPYT